MTNVTKRVWSTPTLQAVTPLSGAQYNQDFAPNPDGGDQVAYYSNLGKDDAES